MSQSDGNQAAIGAADKAARLKASKAKRSQIKSQCTRFRSYLDRVDVRNVSIAELRQRLQKFAELWETFDSVQGGIEDLETELNDAVNHDEERSSFEERYFSISSELEMIIENKLESMRPVNPMQVPREFREGTPATQGSNVPNEHLKLPRVNLPTFSGNFDEWMPFRNMFVSMIDHNTTLPSVQKMQYLLAALKGEACDVISSLEASDENYITAWEMLKERYDDSGLIVQKHIRALFDLPIINKENHLLLRRMIDGVLKHLRALKALKRPTEHWDDIMVYMVTSRLDQRTNRAWEATLKKGEIPNIKQLLDFLSQHCRALEASDRTQRSSAAQERANPGKSTTAHMVSTGNNCVYCGKHDHAIYGCKSYLQLDTQKRTKEARSRKLCLNCLRSTSHQAKQCGSGPCRKCSKRHNTLLHWEQVSVKKEETSTEDTECSNTDKTTAISASCHSLTRNKQVLLATAIVNVLDSRGNSEPCRALLDSGSQSCFITTECAKRLGLKQQPVNIPICGLDKTSIQTRKMVKLTLMSRFNGFKTKLSCLVINQITQEMPVNRINSRQLQIPNGVELADPKFNESSQVDLLLGAEIFFDLMCIGRIKISKTQPMWQKTLLGWIATGNIVTTRQDQAGTICNLATNEILNANMAKFWQIEHDERQNSRSPEERLCEENFRQTYKRNNEGRFIVSLPIRNDQLQKLGESRDIAIQRFKNLERKFERNPKLKIDYTNFMQQYLELGHMKEIREDSPDWHIKPQCYLPHHSVMKDSSATTKLRVVFDASSKTSSGISLNETLLVGPVLQQDLFSILLRFRSFKYVITADVAKMYRQVLIEQGQTSLQRIVWRNHPAENIKTYELLTLAYGTASASFLATRVIQELASLEEKQFPKGALIARRDFYMDDLITGANSIEEVKLIRDQTASLLLRGGFVLRKWASNSQELLQGVPKDVESNVTLDLNKDGTSKTLGVRWNRNWDTFQYSIRIESSTLCTKRSILSSIAQIFDPLGLLAPVLITAKILMQTLWKLKIEWDESLPSDISSEWSNYIAYIKELDGLNVKRNVFDCDSDTNIYLHGFCDASEKAYGACIYIRCGNTRGSIQVHLLCAKSRVAPIKTLSIPKLELCGAQLLVQLMKKVKNALEINIHKTYYWTESSIVLHWIKTTNKKLPVFVAHRIGEIQEHTSIEDWNHVGTKENPADLVSRGYNPKDLPNCQLWWEGPTWLQGHIDIGQDPGFEIPIGDKLDDQDIIVMTATAFEQQEGWINKLSTFTKLVRVTATCIRFIRFCQRKNDLRSSQSLTVHELNYAKECLIKMEQRSAFTQEISALQGGKSVYKNSDLRSLNPFIDDNGLLRVGGRLRHSNLQYKTKHPLVLPRHSRITELIIQHEHTRSFHAGTEATLAAVRQLYWPLRARGTVRKLIRQCIVCFKSKPRPSEHMMGNLPVKRVTPAGPFNSVGIDFCGPIFIREGRRRGAKRVKAYVAVFVCMAVKAVHLEVVSDLTTDAFLNAFKRFISRRGRPAEVFSDNGTNFVGANRELEELRVLLSQEQSTISDSTASEGIKWHFIPARAPHFGGLWESTVKSFKKLFYKVAVEAAMTFEEASTLVTQVEAILNSRPLTALSEDPNDLDYLSPGHFLIGNTLTSYPEPDITQEKIGRLTRWQMLERMRQHFWKRWSSEYLLSLQQRTKWQVNKGPQIKEGQLVLCREDGLPPLKWTLGRVQEVYPGADGIIRAAVIRTASGSYKRPVTKLCVQPLEEYQQERVKDSLT